MGIKWFVRKYGAPQNGCIHDEHDDNHLQSGKEWGD